MASHGWRRWFLLLAALAVAAAAPSPRPYLTVEALRALYADPRGRIATIKGIEVYYKDEGQGPAILLLHGSACSQHSWDGVAGLLTPKYRVIRYDVPGQGLSGTVSPAIAKTVRPEEIAEGLLDLIGVKHAVVLGFSSGGTLGVALAADRPDMVQALVMSNAPADPVQTAQLQLSPAFAAAQAAAKASGFQDQDFWNAFLDFFAGDPSRIDPATRRQFYDMNRRVPDPKATALIAKVADHERAVAAMAKVRAPTLLIWGGHDPLLPLAAAQVLKTYLTSAQVSEMILPDVGHYPPIEAPARFARIAQVFIEDALP